MNSLKLMIVLLASLSATIGNAQAPNGEEQQEFVIAHRLQEWQTKHFDDAAKAQQHADALKKLGAEVRVDQHSGHTDLTYRSQGWKPFRISSDELAHQWNDWLKASGFETIHGHAPEHDKHAHHEGHNHAEEHGEVVLYRSAQRRSQHFNDSAAADEFATLALALGCQVEKGDHSAHIDVAFSCPEWMAVEFSSHESATVWMKWLEGSGFEVRHEHGATDSHAGHNH